MHGFFFLPVDQNEWKDTINVPGNETVAITPLFDARDGAEGSWMYHCHIFSHAEGGMMGEIEVQ
jgi:FtsP/CotA-like multicopper oxidase with cupredoxin domain